MKKKFSFYQLLCWLFGVTFVVSGVLLATELLGGQQEEDRYQQLSQLLPEVPRPTPPADGEPFPTQPESDTVTLDGRQILPGFLQLYQLNPDIVGWVQIPGTKVNYPVMQTPEEPEYYLKRNFDRKSRDAGCIFAQWDADVFAPSDNITLYGHHMKSGSMFATLDKYKKRSFFEKNPYIYFDTLEDSRTYQVMAVFKTSATNGFAFHTSLDAATAAEFDAFVAECKSRSLYDTGVEAAYGDQLLTLATCDYSVKNGRLVVVAKRIA